MVLVVNEIGFFNDCFNPYGFEDSDFCIRALKAGYVNYVTNKIWLLHGTDSRHKARDHAKQYKMIFKGITMLSFLHLRRINFLFFFFFNLPIRVFYTVFTHKETGRFNILKNICHGISSAVLSLFFYRNVLIK
ncbi:MAG: hypothetical protein D3924_16540 [Candidatus Electrothrix sp. AR4]|nr:hypothetical protein [Candidatus Electrothrix sp. AR4]